MKDLVTLEVNGKEYFGWTEVEIVSSIKHAAKTFTISVTEEKKSFGLGFEITPGDECIIKIDGQLVLTGYIDLYEPSIEAESHTVTLTGRSKTADIVDCSAVHVPGNFFEQSLDQIAAALVEPFGIKVIVGENVEFEPILKFELNQGESPFQAIERLARKERTLVTDDKFGNLLLTNASTVRYDIVIDRYLSARATIDHSSRYSLYKVKGQQHGPDFGDPLEASQVVGESTDAEITRFRPLIIRPESSTTLEEALRRAIFSRNRAIGESVNVTITVNGFHNSKNEKWEENKLIWLQDDVLGIEHEFLLHTVIFIKSNNGSITELGFSLRTAFELPPVIEAIGALNV
jgi:prophage tail gpP-like protein